MFAGATAGRRRSGARSGAGRLAPLGPVLTVVVAPADGALAAEHPVDGPGRGGGVVTGPQMDELIPESVGYRLKRALLGPPLVSEELRNERLGKPTALAILSSDVMSSSAYATEQILVQLVPAIGLAAFSLVVPITGAILCVLLFVTLLYRQVVQAYPKAGGAYVVSRENFGLTVAQVAGASLLIDYTLTVAVSVASGVDAITSAVPSLSSYATPTAGTSCTRICSVA